MTPASNQKGRKRITTNNSSYKNNIYHQEYGNESEDNGNFILIIIHL